MPHRNQRSSPPERPLSAEFIERCQTEFERHPGSRVFAVLADAYRQMGMMGQALAIARRGVSVHPNFTGGRLAYARVLQANGDLEAAVKELEQAVTLAPESLTAQLMLADALIILKQPRGALQAYKMVLLLDPMHPRARDMVKRWEFLLAADYDEPTAKGLSLSTIAPPSRLHREEEIERVASIADALTVRYQFEDAERILARARLELGAAPEIDRRLFRLQKGGTDTSLASSLETPDLKRALLERWLVQIASRRQSH